jgi:preprotein translocase subunit SecG
MNGIISEVFISRRLIVTTQYIDIALIITSVALIASVILQNKGVGLGGLTGADTGGVFTARRGIEKTLFWITIVLSVIFFALTMTSVLLHG